MALTKSVSEIIAEDATGLLGIHPSWSRVRLRDVATVLNGYAFESDLFSHELGMPLIRIRNILDGSTNTYYGGDYDDQYVMQHGELLIGMDGDFHCARWKGEPALLNQRVCKLDVDEGNYEAHLLDYALPSYLAAINAATSSITVKHLSSRTVEDIDLPLPPRAEQTRIVEKLEELLSDLDAGVSELKAAQRKLVQYRQSLLKAAVEGALTADWRAARAKSSAPQETGTELLQRILTERRARWEASQRARFAEQGKTAPKGWQAKYKQPVAPDTTDLPALPGGWVWATIDQISEVGTGVTPLRSKRQYFEGGTIPWVTSGALNAEIVTASNELVTPLALRECRLEIYPSGSVLVAMYGEGKTRGKCAELKLPATINQAIAALVLDGEAAPVRDHLKTFLLDAYEAMRKQASGGVQPNLNLQIIKSLQLPLPPLDEQAEMQRRLSDQLAAHDAHQLAIDRGLKQSAAQRKNILKAAFAGQLVPQDPNDESASVLLQRIRAERVARGKPAATKRGPKARDNA